MRLQFSCAAVVDRGVHLQGKKKAPGEGRLERDTTVVGQAAAINPSCSPSESLPGVGDRGAPCGILCARYGLLKKSCVEGEDLSR